MPDTTPRSRPDDLEDQLRAELHQAGEAAWASPGLGTRVARRRRRRTIARGAVAASAAVLVGAVALVVWPASGSDPDATRVDVVDDSTEGEASGVSAGESAFAHLEPGWHTIDTGPVPPSLASITWTGDELVVLGDDQVFALEPVESSWRELPPPDFGPFGNGAVVWLGDRLLAVRQDGAASATLGLSDDEWVQHGRVPDGYTSAGTGIAGPSAPGGGISLVWTGVSAIDATHGAVFDPTTGEWSTLPVPDDLVAFTHLLSTNPVWDGHELVLTGLQRAPGLAYDASGTSFRQIPGIGEDVDPAPGYVTRTIGARLDDVAFYATPGLAATFDSRTDTWEVATPVPGFLDDNACPANMASLGRSVVIAPCYDTDPLRLVDGQWVPVDESDHEAPCCIGQWLGVDGVLVVWSSDTDTLNNPDAPYVRAQVWVPEREDGPVEKDTGGGCDALYGAEPWLILFQPVPLSNCVVVGQFQDVQIWNKGTDETSFEWVDGEVTLTSDSSFATGPIGDVLEVGSHRFDGAPYQLPQIRVMAETDSLAADRSTDAIETGMTLAEASAAYGIDLAVDPDLAPGPRCFAAVVPGDPYSPIVLLVGNSPHNATVESIVDTTRGESTDGPTTNGC